jgi:hypothetical protein
MRQAGAGGNGSPWRMHKCFALPKMRPPECYYRGQGCACDCPVVARGSKPAVKAIDACPAGRAVHREREQRREWRRDGWLLTQGSP